MKLHKIKNAWQLIKQSVAGDSDLNYTQGSIGRVTLLLAIPRILEMAMESVLAVVVIFFGAGLGTAAVATVGLTEAMITLLYAVAIGLSMGTTAMVARRIGEQDSKGASLAARSNILIISNKVDSSFFADIEKVSTISLLDDEFTLFALLLLRSLHKRVEHSFVVKSEKMKFSPKASASRNLTSSLDLG